MGELRTVFSLGWPNVVNSICSFLPGFCMLMFMGKFGADFMAGAGLGTPVLSQFR